MFNKINIEVLFQIVIEVFITILLSIGLVTGRIHLLIHPKFDFLMWLSCFILLCIAFVSAKKLFRPRHMNILNRYVIILIPLFLCLIIPFSDVRNDVALEYKYDSSNKITSGDNLLMKTEKSDNLKDLYKENFGNNYIDINDKMFLKWYYDMTFSWDKFKGSRFRFLARVFKPNKDSGFVVFGRFSMVCCMADLQPSGFIYTGKDYNKFKNGQWYYVEAKVKENKKYTFNYEKMPLIYDAKFEKASKPMDEYVYIN